MESKKYGDKRDTLWHQRLRPPKHNARHNASSAEIDALAKEAKEQLLKYATDPMVRQTKGEAELKLIIVVFKAWELGAMEEVSL